MVSKGTQLHRYWTLPIDEPVYFRRADEYVDRFKELLDQAVDDRLRTTKITVFMSGGIDSPALATTACRILRGRSADGDVRAFTTVFDPAMDGNEGYYASLVATHLGIPIHFQDQRQDMVDPNWDESSVHTPEPVANPMNLVSDRQDYMEMTRYSRVWFYGEGPDNALRHEWQAQLYDLIRHRHFGRLLKSTCQLVMQTRSVPFLPRLLRPLKNWWRGESEQSGFPEWLNEDFASRLRLRERWDENARAAAPCPHPLHPEAYRSFAGPLWEHLFGQSDAEAMGAAAEVRHPFVDLRLLRYMLALPAIPWCREKKILRRAMRDELPDPVLRRPKTPLSGDPHWEAVRRLGLAPLRPVAGLEKYVDVIRVPDKADRAIMTFWADLRPRALNYWLRNLGSKTHDFTAATLYNKNGACQDRDGNGQILKAVS